MGKRQRFTKEFKREALRLGRDYMLLHMLIGTFAQSCSRGGEMHRGGR